MFASVVGDEKPGCGLQFLGRLRDVAQFEMRDLAGQGEIADAVEQTPVVPIPAPRQQKRGNLHDLIPLRAHRVEHHEFLQHPMRRELSGREVGESQVSDLLARFRVLQEFQGRRLVDLSQVLLAPLIPTAQD